MLLKNLTIQNAKATQAQYIPILGYRYLTLMLLFLYYFMLNKTAYLNKTTLAHLA